MTHAYSIRDDRNVERSTAGSLRLARFIAEEYASVEHHTFFVRSTSSDNVLAVAR